MASKPATEPKIALSSLTLCDVDTLMKMVKSNDVEEIEIEHKGLKVRIRGKSNPAPALTMSPYGFAPAPALSASPISAPGSGGPAAAAGSSGESQPGEAVGASDKSGLKTIESPMVGTFYRAPAPDAPPYVEVGDRVTEDSVLCIVEAMKLMNEIKAEMAGIVTEILVENGQPVEFGQPLFSIRPSE
ncbi:MAG: acetyl-CoA carboxylase biotin carboxyl carrier protein [Candidatus Sumerlaeota bacterium]|nr:acetyl-CoA carboxylase biotin carboxyl carrier protein [Candidatus Sumerlaeota bacterium]